MTFVAASTENESSDSGDEGSSDESENQQQEEESKDDSTEPEVPPETEPEPEPETPPPDTIEPPVEEEPLPICDGSAQKCITNDGNICDIGQGGHECECSEDMSDCPNHPSLQEPITCPPGQFPAGEPPACVDCEGPCPEPVPPEGPDEDCLFHPELPKCASDNGECPDGFFQNEDANCVPEHPNGCPEGFHSHEDDETGRCIPNDVPCEPGYIIDPDFPTCAQKEFVCNEHPEIDECNEEPEPCPPGFKLKDDDVCHKEITIIINKIIKETNEGKHHNGFPDVDIIGLSVKDNGDAMICVFDIDRDHIQCQDFGMENDKVNQDFWRIIETDSSKNYDNGNTGSDDIDDAIEDIKSQDFSELKDADNHDFGIDLAFVAINPQGEGVTCLNTDQSGKGKSLCEPFKVSSEDVSGQITEGVEFS